ASAGASGALRFADYIVGRGAETFAAACALRAPGVVSKRADSPYRGGTKKAPAWRIAACGDAVPPPSPRATGPRAKAKAKKEAAPDELRVGGVKLTHPDRLLYPDAGITKLELARYYEDVAAFLVPYVEDRPLTLVRSPDGVNGKSFYVRHAGVWAPTELRQFEIKSGTGAGTTMIADDPAGLIALAQMNVLEIHAWNARVSRLDEPDRIVFDLDPGPRVAWEAVVAGAFKVREVLAQFDLECFVKTTGSKGLHVLVPLSGGASFTDTLAFSRDLAQALARSEPHLYSAGLAKAGREDKIFIDYLRNRRGATSVSVYSTRAQPQASVSVPIAWDALGKDTRSDSFHVMDRAGWFAKRRVDPWAGYARTRQKLTARHLAAAQAVAKEVGKPRS
ncbi:MAG TPA: non-homologous end-joining DNA ligase, partial [Polyangia bacterium]|nr:non-homologous end-joining DNA ligase [Polyangia bacterium]